MIKDLSFLVEWRKDISSIDSVKVLEFLDRVNAGRSKVNYKEHLQAFTDKNTNFSFWTAKDYLQELEYFLLEQLFASTGSSLSLLLNPPPKNREFYFSSKNNEGQEKLVNFCEGVRKCFLFKYGTRPQTTLTNLLWGTLSKEWDNILNSFRINEYSFLYLPNTNLNWEGLNHFMSRCNHSWLEMGASLYPISRIYDEWTDIWSLDDSDYKFSFNENNDLGLICDNKLIIVANINNFIASIDDYGVITVKNNSNMCKIYPHLPLGKKEIINMNSF